MSEPNLGFEIQRLEEQFAAHPGSLLFARLADLLRKSGELDRALAVVEEGLMQHPDYLSAHIVRARTLEDMGRDVQAGDAYRGVLTLDAQNLVALGALARMAERTGDREGAAECYGRLLAVDPRNEEAEAALERLVETAGPEAELETTAEFEPEPDSEPEAVEEPEFEPEPEAELEPEPEPPADLRGEAEFEPWTGSAPGEEAASMTGPTDAFGLASDAFGLEPEPDTEWESVGSSGWPWKEETEATGPESAVAGGEPAADDEQGPASRGEESADLSDTAEISEKPESLWPAWGGEAVDARSPWEEVDEEADAEPEATGSRESDETAELQEAFESGEARGPGEPLSEEDVASAPALVGESEPIEPAAVEVEPEPVEAEPEPVEPVAAEVQSGREIIPERDDASDADLPTETLATLYATQGLYREAVTIYEELVRRRPHDDALAERLRAAREELDGGEAESATGATGRGPESEGAWFASPTGPQEHVGPAEPPVRDHLRALLRGEAVPETPGEEGIQ